MGGTVSRLRGGKQVEQEAADIAGLDQDDADMLAVVSAFTEAEISKLWRIFHAVDIDSGGTISREELLGLKELKFNPLGQRVVNAAFESHRLERAKARKKGGHAQSASAAEDAEAELTFKDFVRVLSPFAAGASSDTKLRLAFAVYDFDGDQRLGKSDLALVLRHLLPEDAEDLEELLEYVVDQAMREADVDGDGVLDYEEFTKAVAHSDIKAKLTFNL